MVDVEVQQTSTPDADSASPELGTDVDIEQIVRDVVAQLTGAARPPELNAGGTLLRSKIFWNLIEPAKRELVARVLRDLAVEGDDCPTTLDGVIDSYAEARLFRKSMFVRLTEGDDAGPITNKGKTKALYQAYVQALDRETKLAQIIGLERRSKRVDLAQAFAEQERTR